MNRLELIIALCLLALGTSASAADGPMGVERVARFTQAGYETPSAGTDDAIRWVQIDLGRSRAIDKIKLLPVVDWGGSSQDFPARFRLEVSDDANFQKAATVADFSKVDYPAPHDEVGVFAGGGKAGRFVRLTATRLRNQRLALTKMEVWADGTDAAQGCPVSDSLKGSLGVIALTRPPRPQGDEVVTDNPGNVSDPAQWKPVRYAAQAPLSGVRLGNGLFKTAMQNNIGYLLSSFSVDEMLRPFRERAGKPNPPNLRPPVPFWDTDLPGSSAGRFLMGAGNTLRWTDNAELHRRMDQLVSGIDDCRAPNGYIMAYPDNTIFYSERAAYTRSWVTHGLIEAGYAGNARAFGLLRGYYDWFDQNPYLPELLRRGGQGVQGMIANTRTYFTPIGKPKDLQVVQRYFQENYWLDELAKREDRAIWQYPYDHPHNYLITSLEPYLDLYRATGQPHYLDAAQGGWDLYHDKWEHVGGSIAICEGDSYPPRSYYLHRHTGELCGSVFWARYNQRFHLLSPNQEKYVGEIEKSIYNVALANQVGATGIRYHANLVGHKDMSSGLHNNTCCEGQGTRMLGSLPEYIYSVAKDGLYVDLYAPSGITWKQGPQTLHARMATQFPFSPNVALHLSLTRPTRSKIRIRIPAWASAMMPIQVNGQPAAQGKPGTYQTLDRIWKNGDTIAFTLPIRPRLTAYVGAEQNDRQPRFALQYGPILMAIVATRGDRPEARFADTPQNLLKRLRPQPGQPLHFAVNGEADYQFIPYWEVADQTFTCFPIVESGLAAPEKVDPRDLALASKGATAASDSEYANEPGGTAKVIDGIIANSDDFSNRWHSSLETPHPHWGEVTLPKPAMLGTVIIHFADPVGHPTRFQGFVRVNGKEEKVFEETAYEGRVRYQAKIGPVTTRAFRLVILASANPDYPNAAQVSEIELLPQ